MPTNKTDKREVSVNKELEEPVMACVKEKNGRRESGTGQENKQGDIIPDEEEQLQSKYENINNAEPMKGNFLTLESPPTCKEIGNNIQLVSPILKGKQYLSDVSSSDNGINENTLCKFKPPAERNKKDSGFKEEDQLENREMAGDTMALSNRIDEGCNFGSFFLILIHVWILKSIPRFLLNFIDICSV